MVIVVSAGKRFTVSTAKPVNLVRINEAVVKVMPLGGAHIVVTLVLRFFWDTDEEVIVISMSAPEVMALVRAA